MNLLMKIYIFLLIVILFYQCESKDRFYRPDLPEKLSALGIINADDTTRYIIFEKSFQVEYPEVNTDSLRELSFTISDTYRAIYSFKSEHALKNKSLIKIPDSIRFHTGEKYFFTAKERDCPEVLSEVIVPEPPPDLKFLSFTREKVTNYQVECHDIYEDPVKDVIELSFANSKGKNSYYALLIKSYGYIPSQDGTICHENWYYFKPWESYIEFLIMESDAQGFFAIYPGLTRYTTDPCSCYKLIENRVHAYFMETGNIKNSESKIVLTTQSVDGISVPAYRYIFRIRFLSIPEEMFLFNKSLYSYERNTGDPFSEPVYLNGNIKEGYGVFAICRSSELTIDLSTP